MEVGFSPPTIDVSDIEAVSQAVASGWLTSGEQVVAFESDLADYLGGDIDVVAMSSCTAALQASLAYLGLERGALVAVPTWTFVSSALVGVHLGLVPLLVDVDPETLNLTPESTKQAIAMGARAVVGVHFAGRPLDPEIRSICGTEDVPLIEDAAHAFGSSDDRGSIRGVGSVAACFSFYATKNLTTGEGGALATADTALAQFARAYRQHGMSAAAWNRYAPGAKRTYQVEFPGIKANMTDTAAALGRSQLRRFDRMQQVRRSALARYEDGLSDSRMALLVGGAQRTSAAHLAVGLLPTDVDRDEFIAEMSKRGVSCSVHFTPLHRQAWAQTHAVVPAGGLPSADHCADRAISLPLHGGLTPAQVDYVIACVRDILATG